MHAVPLLGARTQHAVASRGMGAGHWCRAWARGMGAVISRSSRGHLGGLTDGERLVEADGRGRVLVCALVDAIDRGLVKSDHRREDELACMCMPKHEPASTYSIGTGEQRAAATPSGAPEPSPPLASPRLPSRLHALQAPCPPAPLHGASATRDRTSAEAVVDVQVRE